MSRKLCITSADGQTGHLVAELVLTDPDFSSKIAKLTCLTLHPDRCQDLRELGAEVVQYQPHKVHFLVTLLKQSGIDTIFLVPPAHKEKLRLAEEMIMATREAEVPNTVLLSSAGSDLAEKKTQPRLREFIKIESLFLETKYLPINAAYSPCIIRAGFYAENILLYNKDVQKNGKIRIPIGETHAFAPVALGDIARAAAQILTSEGPKGISDKFRGQLIVLTGPRLVSGPEIAKIAKKAGLHMEFEDISPGEAKQLLDSDTDVDNSEKEYLLDYYSLIREGKANYVGTIAFNPITGGEATDLDEFFKLYDAEFKPKKRKIRK